MMSMEHCDGADGLATGRSWYFEVVFVGEARGVGVKG